VKIAAIAILAACLALSPSAGGAATAIGSVSRLEGAAEAVSEGAKRELATGSAVHLLEEVATGVDARLELTLDDGSVLTLGETARLVLDDFVYAPAGESRLHATVAGAFRYVSGKLGIGATRQASVTTPFAIVGVRGTDFWGGPIDGRFGVFLIAGEITVAGGGASRQLSTPGASVDIDAPGSPIGQVVAWPQEKIDRAIATVTFR
jgi:hypothetical protein